MSESAAVRLAGRLRALQRPGSPNGARAGWRAWLPVWSEPAALRAVRATLVVPALFAVSLKVIGNPQMTLFAVFGGFASLLLVSFGGSRRDKATAHLGLAVVGSIALVIGTLVSGTIWLAALVTIPVAFAIFFAGVIGPNTASGVTGALLAYVLPVATAAPASVLGWRLAGWWLASAAATAAVLLISPPSPGDRLRECAAASARALARQVNRALDGEGTPADWDATLAAKHELQNVFASVPLRPTGLATADQGLASVVELLEWCTAVVGDTLPRDSDLSQAAEPDKELFGRPPSSWTRPPTCSAVATRPPTCSASTRPARPARCISSCLTAPPSSGGPRRPTPRTPRPSRWRPARPWPTPSSLPAGPTPS